MCGKDRKFASLGYGNIATIYSDEDINLYNKDL